MTKAASEIENNYFCSSSLGIRKKLKKDHAIICCNPTKNIVIRNEPLYFDIIDNKEFSFLCPISEQMELLEAFRTIPKLLR